MIEKLFDIKKPDYRTFYDENPMECNCGEMNCCKTLTFEHPCGRGLETYWQEKILEASRFIDLVHQPLTELRRQKFIHSQKPPA